MRSKRLNALLLAVAVVLDATILFILPGPWTRLILGMSLLVPLLILASHLGVPGLVGDLPTIRIRHRRFPLLRTNVAALLDEVRRLNWLVVDLDRGFRDRDTGATDMEISRKRLGELLEEIKRTAGRPAAGLDAGADTRPVDPPAKPVGEPPQGTDAG